LETKQRVIEIAAAMGYQNPSKFTEAFFSVMGKRPLEYRKQNEEQ
jgi:araC-type DNA-binding domain-containing proteins